MVIQLRLYLTHWISDRGLNCDSRQLLSLQKRRAKFSCRSAGSTREFNKNSLFVHKSETLAVYSTGGHDIQSPANTLPGLQWRSYPQIWQGQHRKTALPLRRMWQTVYTRENTARDQDKARLSRMQEPHASL
jgi:hypothetical protein